MVLTPSKTGVAGPIPLAHLSIILGHAAAAAVSVTCATHIITHIHIYSHTLSEPERGLAGVYYYM